MERICTSSANAAILFNFLLIVFSAMSSHCAQSPAGHAGQRPSTSSSRGSNSWSPGCWQLHPYQVGSDTTPPHLVERMDPDWSSITTVGRLQGSVVVAAIIDK